MSFTYPDDWQFNPCADKELFELDDKITGVYKSDKDNLVVKGTSTAKCQDGKLEFTESKLSGNTDCGSQNKGERFANGLYLGIPYVFRSDNEIYTVLMSRNACDTAADATLFRFLLDDPAGNVGGEQIVKFGGEPRIDKAQFTKSAQYAEIRRFAESIELH